MPNDNRTPKKKRKPGTKRKGVWVQFQVLEDPDSKIGLILSERIRGKPEYAYQLVHFDEMGPNKYLPMKPTGAKHAVGDIVRSLVMRAEEIIAEREKKG